MAKLTDSFREDVFLSYQRDDATWAQRIAETLTGFGLKVWRDQDGFSIPPGDRWQERISGGIKSARVMIVLWSEHVARNTGSYVLTEINAMRSLIEADKTGARRFLPVELDASPVAKFAPLAPYNADTGFRELYARQGPGGAYEAGAVDWSRAIRGLIGALGVTRVTEVRFVVGAMTRAQAEQLRDDPEMFAVDPEMFVMMRGLMAKTCPFDVSRYGPTPDDWQAMPEFVEGYTVRSLIELYDEAKRMTLQEEGASTHWLLTSYSQDMVSADRRIRNQARDDIHRGPCLVVIDPVSLMHREVFRNLITNGGLQTHPEAFVIGIAPGFARFHADLREETRALEDRLEGHLAEAYQRFKKRFVPVSRTCILNVESEHQLVRWFQVAADQITASGRSLLRPAGPHPGRLSAMRETFGNAPRAAAGVHLMGRGADGP